MQTRVRRARLLVGALLAAGLLAGTQPQAAKADCVWLEAYVTRTNQEPVWVYGKDEKCVAPTPWRHGTWRWVTVEKTGLPDGTPNGFHVSTKIPLP